MININKLSNRTLKLAIFFTFVLLIIGKSYATNHIMNANANTSAGNTNSENMIASETQDADNLITIVDDPIVFDNDETSSVKKQNDATSARILELEKKLKEQEKKQRKFVDKLVKKFSSKKMKERDIKKELESNREQYSALHDRLNSLYKQVKELDIEINDSEKELDKLDKKINKLRDNISEAKDKISEKKDEIENQKSTIRQYILAMYSSGQNDTLDILLSENTLGDAMYELEIMTVLENQGQLMFARLEELKKELDKDLVKLNDKKERLEKTKDEKRARNKELKQQKKAKDELITITKGKEDAYKELIQQAKDEQEEINKDLENLRDQLELFDAKKRTYEIEKNFYDFSDKFGQVSDFGFSWPVDPVRGITAYFMDPSYRAALGVNHYAIDIRASMQTPIHAAQSGYVYKAIDSGYGYSYIVLLHSKEVSTVYGHIYEFAVEEGDWVEQGDIIGYTGGQPGTKGAGFLTTGPHLHFEVRINGKAKDPLNYLP